jgi:hypothetical protein
MAWWKTRLKEKAETSQTIITPELVMIFLTVAVLCQPWGLALNHAADCRGNLPFYNTMMIAYLNAIII